MAEPWPEKWSHWGRYRKFRRLGWNRRRAVEIAWAARNWPEFGATEPESADRG